jgi:hypothetical protein
VSSLGECDNRNCSEPAIQEVTLSARRRDTGDRETLRYRVCAEHLKDFTSVCVADGCTRVGVCVTDFSGTALDGSPKREELRFCEEHWTQLENAQTVTIDGVTMIHDGNRRMKALPPPIGQG